MQGIYIPETNYVPREYSVAAILLLLFMVFISLALVFNLLYFCISTLLLLLLLLLLDLNIATRFMHIIYNYYSKNVVKT
jgi:uncharacterized membrane protein